MTKKVFIIISSNWGHVYHLAKSFKEGLEKVQGVTAEIYQVPETLSSEVLEKMHAQKLDLPVMDPRSDEFKSADAYAFGVPTRYGLMCAQMKAFWDGTGNHWSSGALVGKPATIFVSTNTQHGGQETTALTTVTHFTHHGMVYVPLGYTHPLLFAADEVIGGSPYGAGTITQGRQVPSEKETQIAIHHGEHFGKFVHRLHNA